MGVRPSHCAFFNVLMSFEQFSKVFKSFQKFLKVFISFQKFSKVFKSFQKFSKVFKSFHKFSQVFTSFHKCSQVFTSFHKFSQFFTSFHKFSQVFTSFHKFSQVFTSFHKFSHFSKVFTFFHKFSQVFISFHKFFHIFSNKSTRLMTMALFFFLHLKHLDIVATIIYIYKLPYYFHISGRQLMTTNLKNLVEQSLTKDGWSPAKIESAVKFFDPGMTLGEFYSITSNMHLVQSRGFPSFKLMQASYDYAKVNIDQKKGQKGPCATLSTILTIISKIQRQPDAE